MRAGGQWDDAGQQKFTYQLGIPSPWFQFETWPEPNSPFRNRINLFASSMLFPVVGFALAYMMWRIEKVRNPKAGFWQSPQLLLIIWLVLALVGAGNGMWMGFRALDKVRPGPVKQQGPDASDGTASASGTPAWIMGSDGPALTDGFARNVLKLQPMQIEEVNKILQAIYEEYPALEAQNTEQHINDAGHIVVRIKTFADQIEKLEGRLWSQLDAILDPQQQSIARLNLKLDIPENMSAINLGELVRPGFFGWEKHGLYLEVWRVGAWYHWKVQSHGVQGSSRAPQLPEGYRRFWKEPVDNETPPPKQPQE